LGGPHKDLSGAWTALTRDPVGILLPAAGLLLFDVLAVRWLPWPSPTDEYAVMLAVFLGIRTLWQATLRWTLLAAGARALNARPLFRWHSLPSMWLIDGFRNLVSILVGIATLAPLALVTLWLFRQQLQVIAGFTVAGGALFSLLLWITVRALLAPMVAEVILGKPAWKAMIDGLRYSKGQFAAVGVLIAAGDLLTGVGGALCGAGALPGYPISDLAVLYRRLQQEPPPV